MPKLVSMARTKAELKAQEDKYKTCSPMGSNPYPYGLCITLDQSSLKKLGLKPNQFAVGEKVTITAVCEVSGVRQNNTKTNDDASVELQIETMSASMGEDGSAVGAIDRALAGMDDDE